MKRKASAPSKKRNDLAEGQFNAEANYADSIFRNALGDTKGSIEALERALKSMPTYAPAILSMGLVLYQSGSNAEAWKLFESLFALPDETTDLCRIIDEAGTFLIQIGAYEDGIALYRKAVRKYPDVPELHQGLGCCAGHVGAHEEAVRAMRRMVELAPGNQEFVNDLGWTLFLAGQLPAAIETLVRAVAMDPTDDLARENLRFCREQASVPGKHDEKKRRAAQSTSHAV